MIIQPCHVPVINVEMQLKKFEQRPCDCSMIGCNISIADKIELENLYRNILRRLPSFPQTWDEKLVVMGQLFAVQLEPSTHDCYCYNLLLEGTKGLKTCRATVQQIFSVPATVLQRIEQSLTPQVFRQNSSSSSQPQDLELVWSKKDTVKKKAEGKNNNTSGNFFYQLRRPKGKPPTYSTRRSGRRKRKPPTYSTMRPVSQKKTLAKIKKKSNGRPRKYNRALTKAANDDDDDDDEATERDHLVAVSQYTEIMDGFDAQTKMNIRLPINYNKNVFLKFSGIEGEPGKFTVSAMLDQEDPEIQVLEEIKVVTTTVIKKEPVPSINDSSNHDMEMMDMGGGACSSKVEELEHLVDIDFRQICNQKPKLMITNSQSIVETVTVNNGDLSASSTSSSFSSVDPQQKQQVDIPPLKVMNYSKKITKKPSSSSPLVHSPYEIPQLQKALTSINATSTTLVPMELENEPQIGESENENEKLYNISEQIVRDLMEVETEPELEIIAELVAPVGGTIRPSPRRRRNKCPSKCLTTSSSIEDDDKNDVIILPQSPTLSPPFPPKVTYSSMSDYADAIDHVISSLVKPSCPILDNDNRELFNISPKNDHVKAGTCKKQEVEEDTIIFSNKNKDKSPVELEVNSRKPIIFPIMEVPQEDASCCDEIMKKIKSCPDEGLRTELVITYAIHKKNAVESIKSYEQDLAKTLVESDVVLVGMELGQIIDTTELEKRRKSLFTMDSVDAPEEMKKCFAKQSANDIASCLWKYFTKYEPLEPGKTRQLILWTETDSGQNLILMTILILLVRKNRFTSVTHKVYFRNHSIFNEKDNTDLIPTPRPCPKSKRNVVVEDLKKKKNFVEYSLVKPTGHQKSTTNKGTIDLLGGMQPEDFLDFNKVFETIGCPSTLDFSKVLCLHYERQCGGLIQAKESFSADYAWEKLLLPNHTKENFNGQMLIQWDWATVDSF